MKEKKGVIRYKKVHIEATPTSAFPKMVTIVKTTKKMNSLVGKRFVTLNKAYIVIDALRFESLVENGNRKAREDLMAIGLGEQSW